MKPRQSPRFVSLVGHLLPIGLLLAMQLALALTREQPLYLADEAGYLANARYLSGAAPMPTFHGSHFYPFGYSLFLIPAFLLFNNPYTAYSASLVIGIVLMSTVYFSLYYLLTPLLGIPTRVAMVAAFASCLYPPLLLRANFAWAEAAYVPGFMLLIALFGALLRYKTIRLALAFGLLLGFMYTIHSRSLALLPIGVISLFTLGYLRSLSWKAVSAAVASTALVFLASRVMVEHLRHAGGTAVPEIAVSPVIAHLLTLEGLLDMVSKVNEQAFYLTISTFGLFFVGILTVGRILSQSKRAGVAGLLEDPARSSLTFFVLIWLGTLVLSAAFLGSIRDETQFLIGRFIDGISAPFIALGIAGILLGINRWSHRRAAILAGILAGSTLATVYSLSTLLPNTFEPGVYAYFALLGDSSLALVVAPAVAAVGFVACTLVRGRWRFLAAGAITTPFLFFTAYAYFSYTLPLQDRVVRSSSLAPYIRAYFGTPATIAYDTAAYHPLPYFSYEFLLPHTRFIPFDSSTGELPPASIVISSSTWPQAETLGAVFWQAEPRVLLIGADQALWTLPSPAQSALIPKSDYANSVLGIHLLPAWSVPTTTGALSQSPWGVQYVGLLHPNDADEFPPPVRFSNAASLSIPTGNNPPHAILLSLAPTAQQQTTLLVQVNNKTVFHNTIPSQNSCLLLPFKPDPDLQRTTVRLSIPSSDSAITNVTVRGITLLDHIPDLQNSLDTKPLPTVAYRSTLSLVSPPFPQPLVRGAMGSLRLTVTNDGNHYWPTPCESGQTPGTVTLGILWFPLNSTDRSLSARVAEGRAVLPYALGPGDSLTLTAVLAPFKENGDPLPPGDYEIWIGPVQEGVSWFFQHGDEALKVPVSVVR